MRSVASRTARILNAYRNSKSTHLIIDHFHDWSDQINANHFVGCFLCWQFRRLSSSYLIILFRKIAFHLASSFVANDTAGPATATNSRSTGTTLPNRKTRLAQLSLAPFENTPRLLDPGNTFELLPVCQYQVCVACHNHFEMSFVDTMRISEHYSAPSNKGQIPGDYTGTWMIDNSLETPAAIPNIFEWSLLWWFDCPVQCIVRWESDRYLLRHWSAFRGNVVRE